MHPDSSIQSISESPVLLEILRYWLQRVHAKGYCRRADIDPLDLVKILPHVGLINVRPDGDFSYRLIGTEMTRRFGQDFTGSVLSKSKSGRYMEFLAKLYTFASSEAKATYHESVFEYTSDRHLTVKRLLLPMRPSFDAPVNMLLFSNQFRVRNPEDATTSEISGGDDRVFLQKDIRSIRSIFHVTLESDLVVARKHHIEI